MIDNNLLSDVYSSLVRSEKDFFRYLPNDKLKTCKKIAYFFSDKAKFPLQITTIELQQVKFAFDEFKLSYKIVSIFNQSLKKTHSLFGWSRVNEEEVFKKLHPEQQVNGGYLDNIPFEIFVKILSEGVGFDYFLVSKQWSLITPNTIDGMQRNEKRYAFYREQIWKGMAERLGCSQYLEKNKKFEEKVKQYCKDIINEIEGMKDLPFDRIYTELRGLYRGFLNKKKELSFENMMLIKEWRKAIDFFTMWDVLSEKLEVKYPIYSDTIDERIAKAKDIVKLMEANSSKLDTVTDLNLKCKKLSTFPAEIGKLRSLRDLICISNDLRELPPEIGGLSSLTFLNMFRNKLATLPPEFGKLSSLERLNLSLNKLEKIPAEIASLKSLKHLELATNNLSSLPVEFGSLKSLTDLDLSNNQFENFPFEIINLKALVNLRLGRNQISLIPPEIEKISNLEIFNLSENPISTMPTEFIKLANLRIFFIPEYMKLSPDILNSLTLQNCEIRRTDYQ